MKVSRITSRIQTHLRSSCGSVMRPKIKIIRAFLAHLCSMICGTNTIAANHFHTKCRHSPCVYHIDQLICRVHFARNYLGTWRFSTLPRVKFFKCPQCTGSPFEFDVHIFNHQRAIGVREKFYCNY